MDYDYGYKVVAYVVLAAAAGTVITVAAVSLWVWKYLL